MHTLLTQWNCSLAGQCLSGHSTTSVAGHGLACETRSMQCLPTESYSLSSRPSSECLHKHLARLSCVYVRSSTDEYTPPDQVDTIQREVLSVLKDLYKDLDVKCLYQLQE